MSEIMQAIRTFYKYTIEDGIFGYYTIGDSPINYDSTVSFNEALNLMERGLGPQHCGNCQSYGSVRGAFIGPCANCANDAYLPGTCECFYKCGGSIGEYIEYGGTACNGKYCTVKRTLNHTRLHNIGVPNFKNIFYTYYDKSVGINNKVSVISTHTYFSDFDTDSEDEDEDEDEDYHELSIIHPELCTDNRDF
jgi:hypothetical protein